MRGPSLHASIVASRFRLDCLITDSVWEATDLTDGRPVIVRTVDRRDLSPQETQHLQTQCDFTDETCCPQLARVVDCGETARGFYFALSTRCTESLATRLERSPLSVEETVAIGLDLCRALTALHDRSLLHLGVSPASIVIGGQPVHHASLLYPWYHHPTVDPSYLPPEQSGALRAAVGPTADLYALGLVLYTALLGHTLFGGSVSDVLRQHLTAPLPPLPATVPRPLQQILSHLTHKLPTERYQSAPSVLQDLLQVQCHPHAPLLVAASDARETLANPQLVGRTAELSALRDASLRAAGGFAGLVLLLAPSGGGKTRLLDEFEQRATQDGFLVIRAAAQAGAARRPVAIGNAMVADLRRKATPTEIDAILTAISPHADTLLTVFPQFERSAGFDAQPTPMDVLRTFVRFPDAMGTVRRGLILMFDDLQWFQPDTLHVIMSWQRHHTPDSRVLIVGTCRTEASGHIAHLLPLASIISLAPLTRSEVSDLVTSMAGPSPPELCDHLAPLGEGNPFLTVEALRGLVEDRVLRRVGSTWELNDTYRTARTTSRRASLQLAARVAMLPPEVLSPLICAAVLGRSFDLSDLQAVLSVPPADLQAALQVGSLHQLVCGGPDSYTFRHDLIRDEVLSLLSPAQRADLHHRVAQSLPLDRPYDVAWHYHRAGDLAAAYPCALQAARDAHARGFFAVAAEYYGIALRGCSTDVAASQGLAAVAAATTRLYLERCRAAMELAQRGQLTAAIQLASQVYRECHTSPMTGPLGPALLVWATAGLGQVPTEVLAEVESLLPPDSVAFRQARALCLFYAGLVREATLLFDALPPGDGVLAWRATCWRMLAERCRPEDGVHRNQYYQTARRHARAARARAGAVDRCHAERESGLLSAARGHVLRARTHLDNSLAVARDLGLRYQEALSLQAWGRVGRAAGWPDAVDAMTRGEALQSELEAGTKPVRESEPLPLALQDRLDTLLDVGHLLASSTTEAAVYHHACSAAVLLMRAQTALVLAGEPLQPVAGPPDASWSAAIVEEVRSSHDVVIVNDGDALHRSVLCLPIRRSGRSTAFLYLSNSCTPFAFQDQERHLSQFVASMAGSALENVAVWQEQVAAIQAMEISERRFRTLFEVIDVGIVVVDANRRILACNPFLLEMLGHPLDKLVGAVDETLFHPDDAAADREAFRQLAAGDVRHYRLEVRCQRHNGAPAWTTMAVSRLAEGQEAVAIRAISDISYRKVQQVAVFQETERRLLAAELHDVVSQPLTGLFYEMQSWSGHPQPGALDVAAQQLGALLQEVTHLMIHLRPPSIETNGLLEVLHRAVKRFEQASGLQVVADLDSGLAGLNGLPAVFVCRIVQEGLANVRRHAGASHVRVTVRLDQDSIEGEIADNGRGFDGAARAGSDRLGLVGLRDRVELLGGQASIVTSPGQGTRVRFRLPAVETSVL